MTSISGKKKKVTTIDLSCSLFLFSFFSLNVGHLSCNVLISVFKQSKLIIFVQQRESKVMSLQNKTELRLIEVVLGR